MDYRCNQYNESISNIKKKKNDFLLNKSLIGRYTNHYSLLKEKKEVRAHFDEIYHCKCAYCGVSFYAIDYHDFEIDHFNPTKPKDNSLNNLVLSCKKCNRTKSDFYRKETEFFLFPDEENIANIFERNDIFEIVISARFLENKEILDFYVKLEFGNHVRQLDYLLTLMCDSLSKNNYSDGNFRILSRIKEGLRNRRNALY